MLESELEFWTHLSRTARVSGSQQKSRHSFLEMRMVVKKEAKNAANSNLVGMFAKGMKTCDASGCRNIEHSSVVCYKLQL